jgi:hypothetical protein
VTTDPIPEVDTEQGYEGPIPRELYQDLADRRARLKASIATLERQRTKLGSTIDELLYPRLVAWREAHEDAEAPRTPEGWGWREGEEPWGGWWRDYEPSWEFCGVSRSANGPEVATFRMWLLDDDGEHAFHYSIPVSFVFGENQ